MEIIIAGFEDIWHREKLVLEYLLGQNQKILQVCTDDLIVDSLLFCETQSELGYAHTSTCACMRVCTHTHADTQPAPCIIIWDSSEINPVLQKLLPVPKNTSLDISSLKYDIFNVNSYFKNGGRVHIIGNLKPQQIV